MSRSPTIDQMRAAARRIYHKEGEIEIDDFATVSRKHGASGAFVACWGWVNDSDAVDPHASPYPTAPQPAQPRRTAPRLEQR